MTVTVAPPVYAFLNSDEFLVTAPMERSVLSHTADVGAGVRVGVDLTTPGRWCSVEADVWDVTAAPVVRALIGEHAQQRLQDAAIRRGLGQDGQCPLQADPAAAAPWIKVALTDALDRWLPLPLDQSLVDAERAVVRWWAGRTLPRDEEKARSAVVSDALLLARDASAGVVRYVRSLRKRRLRLPAGLLGALARLADGYEGLLAEVEDQADAALEAVVAELRSLADGRLDRAADPTDAVVVARPGFPPWSDHVRLASLLDPRQVPARVFALADDPSTPEVTVVDADPTDASTVLVRLPAYGRARELADARRLLVRLVNAGSDKPHGQALLKVKSAFGQDVYCEARVHVPGRGTEQLRADVYDALIHAPVAVTDAEPALREARRAVMFLGEWRRLLADAHLPTSVMPHKVLRQMADRLAAVGGINQPLFTGGPSPADVVEFAKTCRPETFCQSHAPTGTHELLAMAQGPEGLLVAEFAAAEAHGSA
jgi:hypothetical protein